MQILWFWQKQELKRCERIHAHIGKLYLFNYGICMFIHCSHENFPQPLVQSVDLTNESIFNYFGKLASYNTRNKLPYTCDYGSLMLITGNFVRNFGFSLGNLKPFASLHGLHYIQIQSDNFNKDRLFRFSLCQLLYIHYLAHGIVRHVVLFSNICKKTSCDHPLWGFIML